MVVGGLVRELVGGEGGEGGELGVGGGGVERGWGVGGVGLGGWVVGKMGERSGGGGGLQGLRRREGVREGSVMGLIEKPLLRKKQIMRGGFFSFRIDYRWRVGGEAIRGEQYGYEGLAGSRRGVRLGCGTGYRMSGHERLENIHLVSMGWLECLQ